MQRKLDKDEVDFCERWIKKASEYDLMELSNVFDKFFTLFVIFNCLYNLANDVYHYSYRQNQDKKKALEIPIKMLDTLSIAKNKALSDKAVTIASLIKKGTFRIHSTKVDKRLLSQLSDNDSLEKKEEAILELIYYVRCNLFHGEKSFKGNQKLILLPCIEILAEVNQMMFEKMRA